MRIQVATAVVSAALLGICSSQILAQGSPPVPARITIELETRQRWMNARQMAIHTPTVTTTHLISVDSIVTDSAAATRVFWGRSGERRMITDPLRFTTRLDGHLTAAEATPRQSPGLAMARTFRDSARMSRFGAVDFTGVYLALPATRAWDAVPVYRGRRLQPGERWTDTLSYASAVRDMQQSMTGRRVYTIVRDTTVEGRPLWIMRDSASVEVTERYPTDERRLDSLATIERRARGFIIGRSLYDPSLGLFRARKDSTALSGEALLRYPDGRVFTSPTRLERVRKWTLYEPEELARREAQVAAQRDSNSFSIVSVPRNSLEERLVAGHVPTVDSVFRAWSTSRDPDQRAAIKTTLNRWARRDSVTRVRIDAALAAEGDTIYLIDRAPRQRRITLGYAELLLRFMRDPGLAFQHGVSRDIPYERMVEELVWAPPAIEPDTAKWPCEPSACALIADQWPAATEPRLKSVALSVRTLIEPRRWRDTFLVLARAGDNVSQLAAPVVMGSAVGGLGVPIANRTPIPDANADWTAWRDWLRGPATTAPAPPTGRGALPPRPPSWLTASGNPKAIRFVQVATGRDIVAELRRLIAAAPTDTARVVIGNILVGMGAFPANADTVLAYVTHASPLLRSFGTRLASGGISAPVVAYAPADSATSAVIHGQLLTAITNRREPWPTIEEKTMGGGGAGPFRAPPTDAPDARHPVYYDVDSVAPHVRAQLGGQFTTMSIAQWNARSSREGGELWRISRVERSGRFARVSVTVSGRIERASNQGPQAWASWTTYVLVEIDGAWVLLTKIAAVT